MSILDVFRKKGRSPDAGNLTLAPVNFGSSAVSGDWGGEQLYGSDIVVQSIRCKANEFKKLQPRHIRRSDKGDVEGVWGNIQRLLDEPNEYMTQSEFLEKITILLELNKNVYIYPTYHYSDMGEKVYDGLYPLKPSTVEVLVDRTGGMYYKFAFANGYNPTIPIEDIIHWKKDYGVDDYFGGNGSRDAWNLNQSVKYYNSLLQSIGKALNASYQVNGILKVNSMMSDEKIAKEREAFVSMLRNNESGLMVTDYKTEYIDMKKDVKLVDTDTIKFMYENILRASGTPLAILSGDYTKTQKEAYYEHALESDIKGLGEAFTKRMFTAREKSFGNRILFYPSAIEFMTTQEKLSFSQIAVPSGSMMKDEFREMFGLPPMPNEMGRTIAQGYNTLIDVDSGSKQSHPQQIQQKQTVEETETTVTEGNDDNES